MGEILVYDGAAMTKMQRNPLSMQWMVWPNQDLGFIMCA